MYDCSQITGAADRPFWVTLRMETLIWYTSRCDKAAVLRDMIKGTACIDKNTSKGRHDSSCTQHSSYKEGEVFWYQS